LLAIEGINCTVNYSHISKHVFEDGRRWCVEDTRGLRSNTTIFENLNYKATDRKSTAEIPDFSEIEGFKQAVEIILAGNIYKSQGSEYPVVILPLYTQHYMFD
jgi:hypothetical protein